MKYIVPVGRIFYSLIFILASFTHFSKDTIAYAAHFGVPMPGLLVPAAGVLAFLGGLSVLLGYRAKIGAWLLVLFLVPVTIVMHRFWGMPDPQFAMLQEIMFMKNLSMLGAALMITYLGSGPCSLCCGISSKLNSNCHFLCRPSVNYIIIWC